MKLICVAIALCLQTGLVFSQVTKDSLAGIELPEAIIKTSKYGLLDERNKTRISSAEIKKQNAVGLHQTSELKVTDAYPK